MCFITGQELLDLLTTCQEGIKDKKQRIEGIAKLVNSDEYPAEDVIVAALKSYDEAVTLYSLASQALETHNKETVCILLSRKSKEEVPLYLAIKEVRGLKDRLALLHCCFKDSQRGSSPKKSSKVPPVRLSYLQEEITITKTSLKKWRSAVNLANQQARKISQKEFELLQL